MKKSKQSGYEAVFNAPMSFSLLLSVASPEEREAILTSTDMTSAAKNCSPKQRSKHTSKKGRRS